MAILMMVAFSCAQVPQPAETPDPHPKPRHQVEQDNEANMGKNLDKLCEQYALAVAKVVGIDTKPNVDKLFQKMQKDWQSVLDKRIICKYLEIVKIAGTAEYINEQGSCKYTDTMRKSRGYGYIYRTIIKKEYKSLKPFLQSLLAKTKNGPIKAKILKTIFSNRTDGDIELFAKYLNDKQNSHERAYDGPAPFRICDLMFRYIMENYGITKDDLRIVEEPNLVGEDARHATTGVKDSNIASLKEYLKNKGLPKLEKQDK